MAKRYCEGIDCLICTEIEPCIYKIANKQAEIIEEYKKIIKERTKNENLETKTI